MTRDNPPATTLGDLERLILDVVWSFDRPIVVRELAEQLEKVDGRKRAYTTVMTVADRLEKKGLLTRERDGRAWRYAAAASREEMTAQALRETFADWGGENAADAMLHFVQDLPAEDVARLKAALNKL
ncbi:BlaI/MecI/CopY family transcriptional regulator [Calidifontibacter terrae]